MVSFICSGDAHHFLEFLTSGFAPICEKNAAPTAHERATPGP